MTVDVSGERIVAVKALAADYSVFELVSTGIVLDEIKIDRPVVRIERDASGWNLARLVKRERKEANREGPRRTSLVAVNHRSPAGACRSTIARPPDVQAARAGSRASIVKAGFEYAPVHYTVTLEHVSFRGSAPEFNVQQLDRQDCGSRRQSVPRRDRAQDDARRRVKVNGVIERYTAAHGC